MATYDPEIELMSGLFDTPPREAMKATRAPVPTLPTDDPLFELEPNTGAADALCERLETEQLCGDALDLKPEEVRKIMTAHESEPTVLAKSLASGKRAEELNARLTAIFSNQINHELAPLRAEKIVAKRLDAWNMRAPMRKREFMRMLAPLRAAFQTLTPGVEDRLHSLSQAMEQFVTNAVISEA